ncbi:hypothetical protein PoB_004519100 [Plakobranchus ocellatus]|uniref:Adenylate cyclase MASE7 domain-containing protein n=1 Tax=Plakobranchus ocellatus TaxID=259542 RepID=A0AAV4B5M2_9GAST|nr:hypothetical protein PoB_004519100 [Plakobranchus ocellatus]
MATSGTDAGAVYFELSPKLVLLVRVVNVVTLIMVVLSVIFCFVQVKENTSYYLLVVNLAISALVFLVVNWWYRNGDLGSEKYWFILVICTVIFLQCISTDMFVFKEEPSGSKTTPAPPRTTRPFSWATNIPASTKQPSNFLSLINQTLSEIQLHS